jgi:ATP-dependent RNA helicase DeaD
MLCKAGNVTKVAIGSIRIFDTESHFEVAAGKADAFAKSVEKNGSGERGVFISAIDGPGERSEGRPTRPPAAQRRPAGPIERFDPNAPRPERADRQSRYGSGGLQAEDFDAPATGGWNPAADTEQRAPKPDFDQPRPARVETDKPRAPRGPSPKDKGQPMWSADKAAGAAAGPKKETAFKPKDHKAKRKPQV